MNTQLVEQEITVVPMDQAIAAAHNAILTLNHSYNADVDQSNTMLDELERLQVESEVIANLKSEHAFMALQVKNLTASVERLTGEKAELSQIIKTDNVMAKNVAKGQFEIIENAKKCLQQEKQAKLELTQAKLTISDLTLANKKLKVDSVDFKKIASDPVKMRKKLSTHKANVQRHKGYANQHKENLKKADTDIFKLKKANFALRHKIAVSDIIELHAFGDYLLCLFPHQLGDIEGYKKDQVPLLCLHKGGRGGIILLNDDGTAEMPAAPKGGLRTPKPILDHSTKLLNRFESQGWTLSDDDIKSIDMKGLV